MTKKTVIYALENNEYCLIKAFETLDENSLNRYIDILIKGIDVLINPTKEHMSSIITGVIVLKNKPNTHIINAIKKV